MVIIHYTRCTRRDVCPGGHVVDTFSLRARADLCPCNFARPRSRSTVFTCERVRTHHYRVGKRDGGCFSHFFFFFHIISLDSRRSVGGGGTDIINILLLLLLLLLLYRYRLPREACCCKNTVCAPRSHYRTRVRRFTVSIRNGARGRTLPRSPLVAYADGTHTF
jgi:hypothetical protein